MNGRIRTTTATAAVALITLAAAPLAEAKRTGDGRGGVKAIGPKPGQGVPVTDAAGLKASLAAHFAKFTNEPPAKPEAQCHYFNVIVWPDSYSQFEVLRDLLIEKDYAYNVVLQKKGQPVPVGDNVVTGVQ